MPTHDTNLLYALTDGDHFESLARYPANKPDFYDFVRPRLPSTWNVVRSGDIWFHCSPPDHCARRQGWKIHLSSTPEWTRPVLAAVIPEFVGCNTAFKFLLDYFTFFLANGKSWPRAASGKFITAYPASDEQFAELIERCYARTVGMRGPHILSDRPYRDSRVVFYRYGQFVPSPEVNVDGRQEALLEAPDGATVPDMRLPYFTKPPWAVDPVAAPQSSATPSVDARPQGSAVALKDGAYTISEVLAFRNTGGVYVATDAKTGQQVICKEARPDLHLSPGGIDAVSLLHKEYRLLQALDSCQVAPRPVDLFRDWDHWFLVQECVPGVTLSGYAARESPFSRRFPGEERLAAFYDSFKCVFRQLVDHLEVAHSRGIAILDLSLTNVMFDPDTRRVRLVDLDAACQLGEDRPHNVATVGFAPRTRWSWSWTPSYADDLYGLGAVMLAFFVRINPILGINPEAPERFLDGLVRDFRLPVGMVSIILSLLTEDAAMRPSLATVRSQLDRVALKLATSRSPRSRAEGGRIPPDVPRSAMDYIEAVADYGRGDRLFPADPQVFRTNPVSVAYGASGVLYAFQRVRGTAPEAAVQWLLERLREERDCPPGLYIGLSGVAWVLQELGLTEEAARVLRGTHRDDRVLRGFDLYSGASGWGLANLNSPWRKCVSLSRRFKWLGEERLGR